MVKVIKMIKTMGVAIMSALQDAHNAVPQLLITLSPLAKFRVILIFNYGHRSKTAIHGPLAASSAFRDAATWPFAIAP